MPNLQDYTWQCKYTPANGNLLQTFYIPALSCAVRYDRTTGFFSARTLAAATTGAGTSYENLSYSVNLNSAQNLPSEEYGEHARFQHSPF